MMLQHHTNNYDGNSDERLMTNGGITR